MQRLFIGLILLAAAVSATRAAEPVQLRIQTGPGLTYDVKRFVVAPGAKVELTVHNVDEMMHNLVITQPGQRETVAAAALALGADGLNKGYIPDVPQVLEATPLLQADQTVTLKFTAPKEPGVYPYVCTFPGHALLMYGAMYVGDDVKLPPIDKDPHMPPPPESMTGAGHDHSGHGDAPDGPRIQRAYLPDCGPAAIAVHLGNGRSYCFDAGACRLRYAWDGGFIDRRRQMTTNGDAMAVLLGRVWYRAGQTFPLRFGDSAAPPDVAFKGYHLVDDLPMFRYEVDGIEVHQYITPTADGGLSRVFEIAPTTQPVHFLAEPNTGAIFTSPDGEFKDGKLTVDMKSGGVFRVLLTPVPNVLPLAYFSCNDTMWNGKPLPTGGVVGRALSFDPKGKKQVDTHVDAKQLAGGGTIMTWLRLDDTSDHLQTIIGAAKDDQRFGLFLQSKKLIAHWPGDSIAMTPDKPTKTWHHVAVTFGSEKVTVYLDGEPVEQKSAKAAPPDASLYIGSVDKENFLNARLDEIRIDDRAWTAKHIQAIYQQEAP